MNTLQMITNIHRLGSLLVRTVVGDGTITGTNHDWSGKSADIPMLELNVTVLIWTSVAVTAVDSHHYLRLRF